MQKLCAVSGILPQSFVLAGELKEPVDKGLLSIGGHAYVYRATYEGERVAVKVLRMETVGNPALTRTVRVQSIHLVSVPSHTAE